MSKFLFAVDLDNTLIHSHKHRQADDICVEMLDGSEQSFMTPRTIELLRRIIERDVLIVPVTARSVEQYRRIGWATGCEPPWAVVTNGATLLHDGDECRPWREEYLRKSAPFRGELERLFGLFSEDARFTKCRLIDDSYLFLSCAGGDAEGTLKNLAIKTSLTTATTGRKLYFLPPPCNKGFALRRLREMFSPKVVIAAGDSAMDLPMLSDADFALLPKELLATAKNIDGKYHGYDGNGPFAEWLLLEMLNLLG